MRVGRNPVVIDNTNTQAWQMVPYVRLVCCFGDFDDNILSTVYTTGRTLRLCKTAVVHL